jgi:hypothetical protein
MNECCECNCNKEKKDDMYEHIHCEMTKWMLTTADEAWTELFREKAKKHYEEIMGAQIEQMAKAAAEGSMSIHMGQHKQKEDAHVISEKIRGAMKKEG